MSDSFWHFNAQCPVCKKFEEMADGFETDDWTEVFTFSGCSDKNTLNETVINPPAGAGETNRCQRRCLE